MLHITGEKCPFDLAGVYFNGIQYYDLKQVQFINNSGIADLINIIKIWIHQGKEVRFVNASDNIKKYIKEMGLEVVFYME